MRSVRSFVLALGALGLLAPMASSPVRAQSSVPTQNALTQKMNAYIGCINRLSGRSFDARERYFSWVGKNGPTGKERIVYGTYTIYDTTDCQQSVEKVNALEPHEPALETAATAYVQAVVALAPLLKEADDYYEQENYKDDKMAKGKAMHPRLVAAWDAFAAADKTLRATVEEIQDKRAEDRLAEIEKAEGRKERYYLEAVMLSAKRLVRLESANPPDLAKITPALDFYEANVKAAEPLLGSSFMRSAKAYLVTSKQLMRRIRDKVPYSHGDKMLLSGSGGWMVEGSPPRLTRDYNDLVDSYNRGGKF
ncbi:hypothetical protein GCM10007301_21530 [Azorhizobium oxalatiphilum]|uniref:DUF3829 domain-containing protein n=1 Tax=Azorhizobium oxalatiphilum TaxID=980631 RepID=A0A917BXF8_9HYPH|nr:YiiG family protein [Azorhizobium oxalatiphilum]GGF61476.1 hypothetical protein GCM10007301_21530 [Azorhizobium oxalatiphilum]